MNILITGGSGLVGTRLTHQLTYAGHSIRHLSRSKRSDDQNAQVFQWDIENDYIEDGALSDVDAIIHLAGAGVADKRWSSGQKKIIIDSRVQSANLIARKLSQNDKKLKLFLSASGVGYYGVDTGEKLMTEKASKGDGFLAEVVDQWEGAAEAFKDLASRIVKLRIGVVLDKTGGALSKMLPPIKMGIGSPLGSGNQYMSCIHIEDLCRMMVWMLDSQEEGIYNAVCDNPVTNEQMTHMMANRLSRPVFMPNVPAFVLRMLLGEMADIVIGGNKVSNIKIKAAGFEFTHPTTESALDEILGKD